jgi:uncharacterized protein
MNPSALQTWKKVAMFYALTLLFSSVFQALIATSGRLRSADLLYVTGLMWCPGLAAMVTQAFFRESIRNLGWRWGPDRYPLWGYIIPVGYALPVYAVVWLTGLGGYFDLSFVSAKAQEYGLSRWPPTLFLCLYVAIHATVGIVVSVSRSLGEEIGWRGFLVPELSKVVGFPMVSVISGLMWSTWHYPLFFLTDYNSGTPAWFGIPCFTLMCVGISFIAAWLRLRSGSVWPSTILHGAHNRFIQCIFTPLTIGTSVTAYIIDEFGVGLVLTTLIGAYIAWRKRAEVQTGQRA